jgi:Fis family transcriptional regulator, factor for inversion stimulation protein
MCSRAGLMKQQLEDLVREIRRRATPYQQAVDEFKKAFICTVLRANNGNQSRSARQLGLHRNTLTRSILAMHIDVRAMRPSARRRPPQAELQVLPSKKERLP